jgi:hypothetical protein
MVPLLILGIACEHAFGANRMLGIYLTAGVAGGIVSAAIEPAPTIGASGAIFGLMGCLVAMLRRHARQVQVRDGRIATAVGLWALWQMALGFTEPLIANFAHIGGFIAGCLLGAVVPPWRLLRAITAIAIVVLVDGIDDRVDAAVLDGPRPRTAVIDTTAVLAPDDVKQLERLAASVRQASGADLMIVAIATTSGQQHRGFATDLYNRSERRPSPVLPRFSGRPRSIRRQGRKTTGSTRARKRMTPGRRGGFPRKHGRPTTACCHMPLAAAGRSVESACRGISSVAISAIVPDDAWPAGSTWFGLLSWRTTRTCRVVRSRKSN